MREAPHDSAPAARLSLFDAICLIVGIIVGAGIYQTAPDIAKGAGSWWGVLAIWALGGAISLCGALAYAELGSTYPHQGGDYVYLGRAYGRWAGFLFAWLQLTVVRPGDIVVMAFAFATYARAIYDPLADGGLPYGQQAYAAAAVIMLTVINIVGVPLGKATQNTLTIAKAAGLIAIIVVALLAPVPEAPSANFAPLPASVALILVLFSYGGWNEVAYVAAELKTPRRNILRALVYGVVAVTALYVAVNAAFLYTLGYAGTAASEAVAADAVRTAFPEYGGRLISALVCISALGAINGLIFTGARISYAVGADHHLLGYLGKWSSRTGTPLRALVVQALVALVLIVLLDDFVETLLYTAPAVYLFYMATSLSVIVLRRRDPAADRPYRVTGYPVTPLVFAAVCGYLICSGVMYAITVRQKPLIVLIPAAVILVGAALYAISAARRWAGPHLPGR